ncbi:MAG: Gfo/Idh/MocA family oxidoreductase, partial [Actinomycetota bacterium]
MSTLSMGLLGAGRIGKVHAEAIAATAATRLVAVADAFPEPANELAVQHECDVRSVEDVITSDDVDAVLIATPTDLHAEQIEAAAR